MTVTASTPTPADPGPRQRRWVSRRARLLASVAGVVVAILAAAMALWLWNGTRHGARPAESNVPTSWRRPVVTADGLVQRSGVKVTQIAVTGDGGLVDVRYRVVDPERASTLHDPATPPAVVDEDSGLVVHELFMNHAHTGPYEAGVTYYLVFNNPGNWVQHGSKVTVMLGDAQVEHVLVP